MTAPLPGTYADEQAFLDSVEGEISFFRSLTRARPLGKHRHFQILSVRNAILKDTGRTVHIESIWDKLRRCYNIDALEAIVSVLSTRFRESADAVKELEAEHHRLSNANATAGTTSAVVASTSSSITPPFQSLSPSDNLARHPFFMEFSLPYDEFESLFAQRRIRETASLPSSPAPIPAPVEGGARPATTHTASRRPSVSSSLAAPFMAGTTTRAAKRKIGRSRLNLAGLVGGDSDSSALTLESGDEGGEEGGGGGVGTPKESIVTGGTGTGTDADGRTEDGDEEDVEMREASTGQAIFGLLCYISLLTPYFSQRIAAANERTRGKS